MYMWLSSLRIAASYQSMCGLYTKEIEGNYFVFFLRKCKECNVVVVLFLSIDSKGYSRVDLLPNYSS